MEIEIATQALGPGDQVMPLDVLADVLRGALADFDDRRATNERLVEQIALRVAERVAILPAIHAPPAPALLRVRLHRSPEAWVAFERPLLPTPPIR